MRSAAAHDTDWRLICRQGEPIDYSANRSDGGIESRVPVDDVLLGQLNGTGSPLATIFRDVAVHAVLSEVGPSSQDGNLPAEGDGESVVDGHQRTDAVG